jgi:hypothetical protein
VATLCIARLFFHRVLLNQFHARISDDGTDQLKTGVGFSGTGPGLNGLDLGLTVTDYSSRYLLLCEALDNNSVYRSAETRPCSRCTRDRWHEGPGKAFLRLDCGVGPPT